MGRFWTDEEIVVLVENYEKKTPKEIAERLDRSLDSVPQGQRVRAQEQAKWSRQKVDQE